MLKEKIEEVNELIRKRVLDGDYEFVSCDEYVAKLCLDSIAIDLWIANDKTKNCRVWNFYSQGDQDINFSTDKERVKVWYDVSPFVEKYRKEKLKKEKLELIEQLKSEIDGYEAQDD